MEDKERSRDEHQKRRNGEAVERDSSSETAERGWDSAGEEPERPVAPDGHVYFPTTRGYSEEEMELFFPHELVKFGIIIALVIGILTFFATMVPMPVGEPADPLRTPPGIEPEWYFLAVFQLLKYVPRWLGVGFSFIVFPILLIGVPFLWNPVNRYKHGRRILNSIVALGVLAALVLTVLGYLGFE